MGIYMLKNILITHTFLILPIRSNSLQVKKEMRIWRFARRPSKQSTGLFSLLNLLFNIFDFV